MSSGDIVLIYQKAAEGTFKELKLMKDNNVDRIALLKYFETQLKETHWESIAKTAFEKCFMEINYRKDDIYSELEKAPYNIKKDQCNVIFLTTLACIQVTNFSVRNISV